MREAPTLIDELYRASFRKEAVFGCSSNEILRAALAGARRFVLDDKMSSFLGDLASAAFADGYTAERGTRLAEQMRISARLPHASVWIEYNLRKMQARSRELLGGEPVDTAEVPLTEGWLLRQGPSENVVHMMLFTRNPVGEEDSNGFRVWILPLAYSWTVDEMDTPWPSILPADSDADSVVATGVRGYYSRSVSVTYSRLLIPLGELSDAEKRVVENLIIEWVGVVRRAWALLATINDIPIVVTDVRQSKGFFGRGRIRQFLDHKIITLNVPERKDTRVVARQLIAMARKRAHQVRGHWRKDWRNPGSKLCAHEWDVEHRCMHCRAHRIWVHEHQRGDASIGFVTHDYQIKRQKEECR